MPSTNIFDGFAGERLLTLCTLSESEFVGDLIDHFVAFLEERPDFRAIAFGGHISKPTRLLYSLPDSAGVNELKKFMGMPKGFGAGNRHTLHLKLELAVKPVSG